MVESTTVCHLSTDPGPHGWPGQMSEIQSYNSAEGPKVRVFFREHQSDCFSQICKYELPATSRVRLSYDVAPWGYHQILRFASQREVHIFRSAKMDYSDWGLICGPTRHLFWLMLSLDPINQPLALTINPGWLLIGAQGDIEGGYHKQFTRTSQTAAGLSMALSLHCDWPAGTH